MQHPICQGHSLLSLFASYSNKVLLLADLTQTQMASEPKQTSEKKERAISWRYFNFVLLQTSKSSQTYFLDFFVVVSWGGGGFVSRARVYRTVQSWCPVLSSFWAISGSTFWFKPAGERSCPEGLCCLGSESRFWRALGWRNPL